MPRLVRRVVEESIALSLRAVGRGAAITGRMAGWGLAGVQRGLAPDRSRERSATGEPVEDVPVARRTRAQQPPVSVQRPLPTEARPQAPQGRPLAQAAGDVHQAAAEAPEGRLEHGPGRGSPSAGAPEGKPEPEVVEHEPGAGSSVRARSPHSPLNNPVTEPDLTEWPDPYDHREDPRDPGDEMALGDDAVHTATGSTSTSEPHPSQDPEAEPWEGPKRDKVDQ